MRRVLLLALIAPLLLGGAASETRTAVAVIVHPSRRDTPSLRQIRRIYLRQQRFWDDRNPILPVNQPFGSAARRHFEAEVFGDGAAGLSRHWDEQYFQGVLPPPVLSSDLAVREYVAARPAAIGYVAAHRVDDSIRVVARLE